MDQPDKQTDAVVLPVTRRKDFTLDVVIQRYQMMTPDITVVLREGEAWSLRREEAQRLGHALLYAASLER